MDTTSVKGFPVAPRCSPSRTFREKAAIASSTACTAGATSTPSTSHAPARGARSAMCPTARSSVVLMRSPRAMQAIFPGRPAAAPSACSRRMVSEVTRWRE